MRSKKTKEDLLPWEKEQKPRKPARMDIIPPRTSLTSKLLSTPQDEGREYLELYLMSKEKERLEMFGGVLGKRLRRTAKAWREVTHHMAHEIAKKQRRLPVPEGLRGTPTELKKMGPRKGPSKTSRMVVDY